MNMTWNKVEKSVGVTGVRQFAKYEATLGPQVFRAHGSTSRGWCLSVFSSNTKPRNIEGLNTLKMCKDEALRIATN